MEDRLGFGFLTLLLATVGKQRGSQDEATGGGCSTGKRQGATLEGGRPGSTLTMGSTY